jgi:hypothetical protein
VVSAYVEERKTRLRVLAKKTFHQTAAPLTARHSPASGSSSPKLYITTFFPSNGRVATRHTPGGAFATKYAHRSECVDTR